MDNRLDSKIAKWITPEPNSGCWLWTGGCDTGGYGQKVIAGEQWQVHRLVFTAIRGPIPKGLVLDHLCRVPCCVNPSHMELVTNAENIRRGNWKGDKMPYPKRVDKWGNLPLSIRIGQDLKTALERAAKDDERSMTNKIELILRQWLRENGYLNGKKGKRS